MTRLFLKLYFLLILPLIIMSLLPQSPISLLGHWWAEKEAHRQYGAIYHLVYEELKKIPQTQWIAKVDSIAENFTYPLVLEEQHITKLDEKTNQKLDTKGFALTYYKGNRTLVFSVEKSNFLLYASLYSRSSDLDEFEKDTRGFRYFLNKMLHESTDPFTEFKRIKAYFSLDIELFKFNEFQKISKNKKVVQGIRDSSLYIDGSSKPRSAYILSDNKEFIVKYNILNTRVIYRNYSKYLSIIVPALLLAIGALLWLFLFRKEFKKVNSAAKTLGDGKFDTRIMLSKNSTLYPIADSFNDMAIRVEALLGEHKNLTNAVSHELKTPLSRLHFALEMQKNSKTDKDRDSYTDKIENNILAMDELVNELLRYSRLQHQYTLELKKHSLEEWLNNEINIFTDYHPNIDISFSNKLATDVAFDMHLMSRALNNLLENAANYVDPNKPIIKISALQVSNEVCLIVEDNGKGISLTESEIIFNPFTRLDKSRKRKDDNSLGGYGMGLAIIKSIVEQHKGSVKVSHSELGGAAFTLNWPLKG